MGFSGSFEAYFKCGITKSSESRHCEEHSDEAPENGFSSFPGLLEPGSGRTPRFGWRLDDRRPEEQERGKGF
jgi:hypothetical protein